MYVYVCNFVYIRRFMYVYVHIYVIKNVWIRFCDDPIQNMYESNEYLTVYIINGSKRNI